MVGKKNKALIENLPIICALAVWVPQYLYRIFYPGRLFYQFDQGVYFIMSLAILGYVSGSYTSQFAAKFNALKFENKLPNLNISIYRQNFIFVVLLGISFYFIYESLISVYLSGSTISAARDISLENWSKGGFLLKLNSVFINVAIAMMVSHIITAYNRDNKIPFLSIFIFILLTVSAYSRTHMLIGFSIIAICIIRDRQNPLKIAGSFFIFFISLFMILSIVTKDNSSSTLGSMQIALTQLEVYFFGGTAGLDYYYSMGTPSYNTILTIPKIVQSIFPLPMDLPPSYYDFVDTTPPINVFSSIYPPYHDFGMAGVAIMFFIYGFIATMSCILYSRSGGLIALILAGFFVYSTLMSVFDDQFIRGLPVLLMFVAGGFLYRYLVSARSEDSKYELA